MGSKILFTKIYNLLRFFNPSIIMHMHKMYFLHTQYYLLYTSYYILFFQKFVTNYNKSSHVRTKFTNSYTTNIFYNFAPTATFSVMFLTLANFSPFAPIKFASSNNAKRSFIYVSTVIPCLPA